ncbi:MAG: dTDP-4-dehydrorhamnose reductase [Bacteroidetes bacterium OLB12]|nr:MAG: dTDP-4-dehydrorhamnose reductase [Bacteroidetes bacterium OLB12]HNR74635.1 SDR family oxidoreductase [Cyclobacteriaceae bacterium]
MRILITGANGLLGYKLVQLLASQVGIITLATARKKPADLPAAVQFVELDITNKPQTIEVIASAKPDVVIHAAAMTQVDQCETERDKCWNANVNGVAHIITACAQTNAHLVHVSTDFIFDGTHGPLDETAIPNPVNYYGESKLAGEKLIQQSKISWAILRTVLVYGVTPDMSRSNIVLWVKKSLEEGKTIHVVNDQWRTPTLAEDLAMGCYLAASKKAKGIYHISGSEMVTPFDIAVATARFFNLDASLINPANSTTFTQPARRPPKTGFIITKAQRELGYKPHTFTEGLAVLAAQIKH